MEALADEIDRATAQGRHLAPPELETLARAIDPTCNVEAVLDRLILVLNARAVAHHEHAAELRVLQRWIEETSGAVTLADVERLPGPHQAEARELLARLQNG